MPCNPAENNTILIPKVFQTLIIIRANIAAVGSFNQLTGLNPSDSTKKLTSPKLGSYIHRQINAAATGEIITGAKKIVRNNFLPAIFLFNKYAIQSERAIFKGMVPIE